MWECVDLASSCLPPTAASDVFAARVLERPKVPSPPTTRSLAHSLHHITAAHPLAQQRRTALRRQLSHFLLCAVARDIRSR